MKMWMERCKAVATRRLVVALACGGGSRVGGDVRVCEVCAAAVAAGRGAA